MCEISAMYEKTNHGCEIIIPSLYFVSVHLARTASKKLHYGKKNVLFLNLQDPFIIYKARRLILQ